MTTVREAVKMLSEYLDQDEEICIAWWSKELFEHGNQAAIKEEAWGKVISEFDGMTEYYQSLIYDIISLTITQNEGWIDNE